MSNYSKLKETKLSGQKIYEGVVGFNKDIVRLPNGKTSSRVYLAHRGASAIVPIEGNNIYLVKQYRYPIGRTTWELPAGKFEPGQTPLGCAKAELEQETGLRAKHWKKLIAFYPSSAFSTELLHIYLATDFTKGKRHLDADEFVTVKKFPLKTVYEKIRKGKIRDAKTLIALLLYRSFIEKK